MALVFGKDKATREGAEDPIDGAKVMDRERWEDTLSIDDDKGPIDSMVETRDTNESNRAKQLGAQA